MERNGAFVVLVVVGMELYAWHRFGIGGLDRFYWFNVSDAQTDWNPFLRFVMDLST
jgi:hypothetical protein